MVTESGALFPRAKIRCLTVNRTIELERIKRKERERSKRDRVIVLSGKDVMILGFPRIGNMWSNERSPAVLRADVGQMTCSVVA